MFLGEHVGLRGNCQRRKAVRHHQHEARKREIFAR